MSQETLVVTGATILAGSDQTPVTNQALVLADGKIEAIVSAQEAARRIASGARQLNAKGMTILPGLIDAHGHLDSLGKALESVDLVDTTSYAEVIARIGARAAAKAPGEWIVGRGWDQNDWSSSDFPTRTLLDATVSNHPVWVTRVDGHAALANSAALKAAGIDRRSKDPEGGRIMRDPTGEPTGVFIDAAMDLVERSIPAVSRQERKRRIHAAAMNIAANGLTGMHDAGANQETIDVVKELIDEGRFPIRLYVMLRDNAALLDAWMQRGPLIDYGGRLTVRSIKLYADGALGSRGAAMLEPYSDDASNSGLLLARPEHLVNVSKRALRSRFQVNAHAIGDRGVRNVLEAFEKAEVSSIHRFRIEHLQVIAASDIPRLARSGIIASMQPTHATSDMPWAEQRVGAQRLRGAYAWRSVLNSGARLALGSDFPVEAVNPFFGIYSAVTRQDQKGMPTGGWTSDQRLTAAEAIRGFTSDAAWAAFEETTRGTIEPGKLADLTLVDRNPLESAPSELFKIKPVYTIVGGRVVYDAVASRSSK
ncbi:MAG TPA: amidohydrolase family protein [Thermoanaerobaculia bacterium]|nr:amidohydrolase family protein [Thermoanaerobaculia bacterium]